MTGWTLEYINGLSVSRLHEWRQVVDGRARAQQQAPPQPATLPRPKRRR